MKIQYKTGDLLRGEETVIAHGCNARGVMGGGIAAQIRKHFPLAYEIYRDQHTQGELQLGRISWIDTGDKIVVNAITQQDFGNQPGRVYVSYDAVRECLRSINEQVQRFPTPPAVGFPLIGAGLAGGSWARISQIIEEESTHFQPVVYLYDGVMPKG